MKGKERKGKERFQRGLSPLILLGNTALPVCIYGIATLAYRWAKWRRNYDAYRAFGFLKLYPRKCYTHMFPWDNTVWLCFMIGLLTAVLTVALLWQDSSNLAFSHLSAVNTFTNTLFTAISTRTAGMNSIEVAQLSMSSTFLMIIWMYISALPTVVAMRSSAQARNFEEPDRFSAAISTRYRIGDDI